MTFHQLDKIADLFIPVFAVALLIGAIWLKKAASFEFILRSALAFAVIQQLCKYLQKKHLFDGTGEWPSTHFAVALTFAVCLVFLQRKLWPVAVGYVVVYAALMLYIHSIDPSKYHTVFQLAGSLFAIPLAALFHWKPKKAEVRTN